MEVCPISVIETVTLPAQPTNGAVDYIPLGGNGYSAPHAAYSVVGMTVTGDAGGGSAGLDVTMDDRYCSLITYITFNIAQGTSADADFRLTMSSIAGRIPLVAEAGLQLAVVSDVSSQEVSHTWNPTPVILPGGGQVCRANGRWVNTLADVYSFHLMAYLFAIDVREKTAMGPLLWARGAT